MDLLATLTGVLVMPVGGTFYVRRNSSLGFAQTSS